MLRRRVIERDLFARRDVAQRKEKHVPARDAAEAIRRAGVIDECSRVPANARVDTPLVVELANAHFATARDTPLRLAVRNSFANELTDFFSGAQRLGCETALAVDPRFLDDEMRQRGRHALVQQT